MEAAQRDSALTHFDPLAAEVCALYCVIIAAKLKGQDLLEAPARSEALIQTLNATPAEAARRASAQVGFVLTAFSVAFCADRHFESFDEGMVWAVNLGGDADTNGAVTGALLGARDGVSAIPKRWLDRLEPRAELAVLADRLLSSGWPATGQS
jgi:ADP-ribosyl-[dinitrogen reductase] hydrolase